LVGHDNADSYLMGRLESILQKDSAEVTERMESGIQGEDLNLFPLVRYEIKWSNLEENVNDIGTSVVVILILIVLLIQRPEQQ